MTKTVRIKGNKKWNVKKRFKVYVLTVYDLQIAIHKRGPIKGTMLAKLIITVALQ